MLTVRSRRFAADDHLALNKPLARGLKEQAPRLRTSELCGDLPASRFLTIIASAENVNSLHM